MLKVSAVEDTTTITRMAIATSGSMDEILSKLAANREEMVSILAENLAMYSTILDFYQPTTKVMRISQSRCA
jgi:hypothetical protein